MNNQQIHKAKLWQLPLYACNQIGINMYVFFMGFVSYYLNGFIGVAVVLATSFVTIMRIWDAFTDPVGGHVLDKLETKFGKFRPFMVVGNLGMMVTSYILLHVSHSLPEMARFPFFIVIYMIYVVFMTMQNTVGRAGLAAMTNDPNQRAVYGVMEAVFITLLYTVMPAYFYGTLVGQNQGFTIGFFHAGWRLIAPISFVATLIAAAGIAPADKPGTFIKNDSQIVKFTLKKYWDVLKNNRAMQMLVVSASTDKLATQVQSNATVSVMIYGIICGNLAVSGALAAYTSIPNILFVIFGVGIIAAKLGQNRAMVVSSIGGLVTCTLLVLLFYLGDPTTLAFPGFAGFGGWTFFSLAYLALYIAMKGFAAISTGVITPMIADVTDYEVCRTGNFVPGLIRTVFSFVDKFISSFGATVVGLLCAVIGFTETLPNEATPLTPALKHMGIFCMFGIVMIGLICNLAAMKFYPLTRKKMEEIEAEIARIKAEKGISG